MDNLKTSEADMGYVRDFVQKIAEALVAATELPAKIELMQNDLTALHGDLEKTKARNIELDALVSDIRRQRDEAEQSLSQVKAELVTKLADLEAASNQVNGLNSQVTDLRDRLEQAKRDRDDYGLQHMEAEERAKQAEAKLAKLAEALGMPKPQAEVKPDSVVQVHPTPPVATPDPTPPAQSSHSEPVPSFINPPAQTYEQPTQGSPPHEPVKVYEGDPGFNELPFQGEQWDGNAGKYYRIKS